jgi:hypothetical protein
MGTPIDEVILKVIGVTFTLSSLLPLLTDQDYPE